MGLRKSDILQDAPENCEVWNPFMTLVPLVLTLVQTHLKMLNVILGTVFFQHNSAQTVFFLNACPVNSYGFRVFFPKVSKWLWGWTVVREIISDFFPKLLCIAKEVSVSYTTPARDSSELCEDTCSRLCCFLFWLCVLLCEGYSATLWVRKQLGGDLSR